MTMWGGNVREYYAVGKGKKPPSRQNTPAPGPNRDLESFQRMLAVVIKRGSFGAFEYGWEDVREPDRKVFKLKAEGYIPDPDKSDSIETPAPSPRETAMGDYALKEIMAADDCERHADVATVKITEWSRKSPSGLPLGRIGHKFKFELKLVLIKKPA